MILEIANILTKDELGAIRETLEDEQHFEAGTKTAGWYARQRKNNLQAKDTGLVEGVKKKISLAISKHPVFISAARPKAIAKLMLSRYEAGMSYGTHVDDALIAGMRTDLSFTCFLSDPTSYQGGELVIDRAEGEKSFKLEAGNLILYPSRYLHRVEPVLSGERISAVGWVRSYVCDDTQREALFDLDRAIGMLVDKKEADESLDLLMKTRSNLLRMWMDD